MSNPITTQPRQMGIRMGGLEGHLESLIKQHLSFLPKGKPYTLVEIGSAGCVTLRAFKDIISQYAEDRPWRVIGFDLPQEKAWSLDWTQINKAFDGKPRLLGEDARKTSDKLELNQMYLWLLSNPREYFLEDCPFEIDFAFIDGSHGISCGYDFLAIEKKIAPQGVVVFHDYGEIEQGTDWQREDREFINVRTYVHRLGLAQPSNAQRKGWRFIGEIPGSRVSGLGDGNSCCVVQRTLDPLEDQPELRLTSQ